MVGSTVGTAVSFAPKRGAETSQVQIIVLPSSLILGINSLSEFLPKSRLLGFALN